MRRSYHAHLKTAIADLDIELLTRCVLMAQNSRIEAANTFRNSLKR